MAKKMMLSELIIRDNVTITDRKTNYETGGEIITLERGDDTFTVPFRANEPTTAELVLRANLQDAWTYEQNDFSQWCDELCFDPDEDEIKKKYEKVGEITEQLHTFLGDAYDEYQEGYDVQQEARRYLMGCDPSRYYPCNEIDAWARTNHLELASIEDALSHPFVKKAERPIHRYYVLNDQSPAITLKLHPSYQGKVDPNPYYRLTYIDTSIYRVWHSHMECLPRYEI